MSNESKRILELTNRVVHLENQIKTILGIQTDMIKVMKADGEISKSQVAMTEAVAKAFSTAFGVRQ